MINIERRRKQRKLIPFIIAGAALLIAAAVILLVVLRPFSRKAEGPKPLPTESQAPNPTQAAAVSETPAATYLNTTEPSETTEETIQPENTPLPSKTPAASDPIRISEDQSSVLLNINAVLRYDPDGSPLLTVYGKLSMTYLNNTDRSLYTADLRLGEVKIRQVLLNGVSSNRSFKDGVLTVPLFDELLPDSSVELYAEFERTLTLDEAFDLPSLTYDSTYLLSADITSDLPLVFSGCSADPSSTSSYHYTLFGSVLSPSFKVSGR